MPRRRASYIRAHSARAHIKHARPRGMPAADNKDEAANRQNVPQQYVFPVQNGVPEIPGQAPVVPSYKPPSTGGARNSTWIGCGVALIIIGIVGQVFFVSSVAGVGLFSALTLIGIIVACVPCCCGGAPCCCSPQQQQPHAVVHNYYGVGQPYAPVAQEPSSTTAPQSQNYIPPPSYYSKKDHFDQPPAFNPQSRGY